MIEVAAPCSVPWEMMKGGDSRRFCEHCHRHVHDLSSMTRADAVDLICKNAGALCVRFTRNDDGTVKTLDYAPAKRGSGLRKWLCLSALLGLAGGVGNYLWHRPAVVQIAPGPTQPMVVGMLAPPAPTVPCPPKAENTDAKTSKNTKSAKKNI